MAREDEEEIIIIEDIDAAGEPLQSSDNDISSIKDDLDNGAKNKQIMMIAGGGIALLLIILIVVLILQKHTVNNKHPQPMLTISKKLSQPSTPTMSPSQVEQMIAKANYLYNNNNKQEALHLYEQIAHYNEALSQYNLGVAQLKGKHYKQAFLTFQKAISNNEKVCESAINAAVCALHLYQPASFEYYINLAYAYLPNEVNSPLYSYYYTLIKYYQGHYLEALSALKHPTSKYYYSQQQLLKSKLDSLFGNYDSAIDAINNSSKEADALTRGLLYANIGNYTLAQKYLSQEVLQQQKPLRGGLALALVNLKAGDYQDAVKELKDVTSSYPNKVYTIYPVKVSLKDSLFNPVLAQKQYKQMLNHSTAVTYAQIFYFAPYKIFNANSTLNYIRRGNANIYLNDIASATNYLQQGRSLSAVNLVIAKAIKDALSYKLRDANKQLQKITKKEPQNSILQYNLALTYAQLGNIQEAYKHFTSSYYLDAKNYLAGIFALMSAQLLHKDNTHFNTILKENLAHETG
jgi:predicted Zn-dependent protease